MARLDWQFAGHPQVNDQGESDTVLVKTTDGDLALCEFNLTPHNGMYHWYDINTEEWFNAGIACWAYLGRIPETTQPISV